MKGAADNPPPPQRLTASPLAPAEPMVDPAAAARFSELYRRIAGPAPVRSTRETTQTRAERRAGELLAAAEKAKGARQRGTDRGATRSPEETASLAERGLTKRESADWQKPERRRERQLPAAQLELPGLGRGVELHRGRAPAAKPRAGGRG